MRIISPERRRYSAGVEGSGWCVDELLDEPRNAACDATEKEFEPRRRRDAEKKKTERQFSCGFGVDQSFPPFFSSLRLRVSAVKNLFEQAGNSGI